jgi:uncharacterized membrane protein
MGVLFAAGFVFCIFFLRDVFLLGSTREQVGRKLAIYSLATLCYLLAAVRIASSLSEARALELLRSPVVCVLTLGIHAGMWWAAVRLKRRPGGGMWTIAIAPAPMLILAVVAASHHAARVLGNVGTFGAGAIVSVVWIGLVLTAVAGFRAAYRGWADDDFVGDLAVIAGWTGLWILPLTRAIS